MHQSLPYIDGYFWIFPDGRRLPRLAGGQETDEEKAAREKREADEKEQREREERERSGKPPWGSDEEFNPERAWKLIQDLRGENKQLKDAKTELQGKVREFEDRDKSQAEKDAEAKAAAAKQAAEATGEAARLRVALKKGLTETQAKRLVGSTEEELEKDADELMSSFKREEEEERQERPGRPRERLRPGAAPAVTPEKDDPASLAAEVPRGW